MRPSGMISNVFASILGLFFILEGIWGLNSELVFGILTTNTLHAIIHLILGVTALVMAWAGFTKGYNTFVGILLTIVGLLRFVPGADQVVIDLFNVNVPVAYLNIAIGIAALIVAFSVKPAPLKRRKY